MTPHRYNLIKPVKGQHVTLSRQDPEDEKTTILARFYYIADHKECGKILLGTNAFPPFAFKTWPMDMVPKWAENMAFGVIKRNKLTTCWWVDKKEFYEIYLEQNKK